MVVQENSASALPHAVEKPLVTFRADDARYSRFPHYLFGLHDSGGEAHMLSALKPGWVVISVQVNPPDSTGDFSTLSDEGLGLIVRLNFGDAHAATIPPPPLFDQFALQCSSFVGESKGAHIWIVGDEPNVASEPSDGDGATGTEQVITPELYADCFIRCRRSIRAIPGHENDWVIPAAIAPFASNTTYPSNPTGDWVRYFADVLFQINSQGGAIDGLALHTFTHGGDLKLIASEALAGGSFPNRHWQFRAYRDFLQAVLPTMRNLPVFITAASPIEPGWTDDGLGWITAAFAEINAWNSNPANQPVQALCLYRWQNLPHTSPDRSIADKPSVVADFVEALKHDYRVRWPGVEPAPEYRAQWISAVGIPSNEMIADDTLAGRVVVKNIGAKAWLAAGPDRVRIASRWFNPQGIEIPINHGPEFFPLPRDVLPGQTVIVDDVQVRAPRWQGTYTLRFDLVQQDHAWFSASGSSSKDATVMVQAPQYAVDWQQVLTVIGGAMPTNSNLIGTVTVKNNSSSTWEKVGAHAIRLGYHWYNAQGVEVPVTPYPGNFVMNADTPQGGEAVFEAVSLRSPEWEGTYTLRWDLIHEGITWFSAKGSRTSDQIVAVNTPLPDYAVKWLSVFKIPKTLEPNETVSGAITAQNAGAQFWYAAGRNRVQLGYHWYDPLGNEVPVTPYPGNFSLGPGDTSASVAPEATGTFENVVVRAPLRQGKYSLAFDLVKDGTLWFSSAGSRPFDLAVAVMTTAPDYRAQWIEIVNIPHKTMAAGDTVGGRVVVKNSGALTWNAKGENPINLAYHWEEEAGHSRLTPLPSANFSLFRDVPPRETATFGEIVVQAPDTPGKYTLKWDLVGVQSGWFATAASPAPEFSITVGPPPREWGAEFVAHDTPPSLCLGQSTTVNFRIRNIGKNTWRSAVGTPVYLGSKWINASGQPQTDVVDHRTALPNDIPPGGEAHFAAMLNAPDTPGSYRLQWDLVSGNLAWFADDGNTPLVVPVQVTVGPTQTNLWRAEASHNASSAVLALDGDLGSFWSSQAPQAPGMWFRVNLGAPRRISGIAFRSPGSGYPCAYTVRLSSDGQDWVVAGVAQGNTRDLVMAFAPYPVLFAQIDLLAPAATEWMISEVQVHDSPAWNTTASANSDAAVNAIDDDPSTAWTTNAPQVPNDWFQIDLGRVESVSGLRLVPPQDENPVAYRASAWNQPAGGWQKLSERDNNNEPVDISFAPVQTQYINIQLLQAADRPWAIREAHVTTAMMNWVGPSTP